MNSPTKKIRTGTTLLVAGYWLALFVATHLPHVPAKLSIPGADKWEHVGAYGTLCLLLAVRQTFVPPVNWKILCRIACFVALYGVFDELTQPFVGRHADIADWFADILGSALGLAVFAIARAFFVRRREPSQP